MIMKRQKSLMLAMLLVLFSISVPTFAQNSRGLVPSKESRIPESNFVIPNCTAQPIQFGQTVNNAISAGDCVGTGGSTFRADEYTFAGQAGQQIVITMNSDEGNNPGTNAVDSFLILRRSDGSLVTFNDDGGTNGGQSFPFVSNSRIPAFTGFFTLPANDTYSLEATTFSGGTASYGPYSLQLIDGGVPPCNTTFISYSLPPVVRNGQLQTTDCVDRGQFYTDKFAFDAVAGQTVQIDMAGTSPLDAYLLLRDSNRQVVAENNDGGGGTNARVTYTIPTTGTYFIDASSNLENQTGSYTLTLTLNLPAATIPVSVPTVNGTVGGQVTVPVLVGPLPAGTGTNAVRSFQFALNYNNTVLRPVGFLTGGERDLGINQIGTLSAPFACDTNPIAQTTNPQTVNPGQIQVACFGNGTPISAPMGGTLINLVFDVIGNGGTSTPIILQPFMFNEGNPASFFFTSGGVIVGQNRLTGNTYYHFGTINGAPKPIASAQVTATGNPVVQSDSNVRGAYALEGLSPSSYSVLARKSGDIPARGATLPLPGTPGIPISAFDAALTNLAAVGTAALNVNQSRAADVSGNGVVTSFDAALILQFNTTQTLTTGNRTGQWTFTPPGGVGPATAIEGGNPLLNYYNSRVYTATEIQSNLTNQNWTGILLGDPSGNWQQPCLAGDPLCTINPPPTFAPENAVSVDLPEVTSPGNTTLEIPVNVGDMTGRGAISFDFAVLYNPNVLRPLANPINQENSLSAGYNLAANVSEPGRLRVGAYGLNALTGSGPLLKIRFEVIGTPGANSPLNWENFFFNEGDPASVNTTGTFLVAGRTPFDFDGDGKSDTNVFRSGNSTWYQLNSQAGFSAVNWGLPTDKLAPADYDGDGRTDVAVVRDNIWYILRSNGGTSQIDFGLAGDLPVAGDWDGDGKADVAVYRAGTNSGQGTFYFRGTNNNPSGAITFIPWGLAGDVPVMGDYDGDGKLDAAVFRSSNSVWYINRSSDNQLRAYNFGLATDKLTPADYDGDGSTDIGVYRDGVWYVLKSGSGVEIFNFGLAGDIPVPADYDGDGKADVAVYRGGIWHLLQTSQGYRSLAFGVADDKPIPASFLR
jgi:hypothetical protein